MKLPTFSIIYSIPPHVGSKDWSETTNASVDVDVDTKAGSKGCGGVSIDIKGLLENVGS